MASFEEGLDRVMFVVGALEHERPFLGPLYRFMTLHPATLFDAFRPMWVHPPLSVGADPEAVTLPLWDILRHRRLLS